MTNETQTTQESIVGQRLLSFFERIERLEEEKAALSEDIKEVYLEAKSSGFEVSIIRKIIALRKLDPETRQELEHLIDSYRAAIGMA